MRECPKCSGCHEDAQERCPGDGSPLTSTLEGAVLVDRKYRLERRLSQGGMGVVYLARHVDLQRIFALKLIRAKGAWSPAQLARFRWEAEALGRLKHPEIVDVTDFGIDPRGGGLPYLVMERLEGRTLMEHCRSGSLPIDEALPILEAVGRAVDFAHDHGVLHRDLKPANVFLCDNGQGRGVKLLDFGLARLAGVHPPSSAEGERAVSADGEGIRPVPSASPDICEAPTRDAADETPPAPSPLRLQASPMTPPGAWTGTPLYMAPECFLGGATVASDTYALGVVAYVVLTGRHPFEGSIMDGHLHRAPPLPSSLQPALTPVLDAALLAALAKDPARRPPSATAFVSRLQQAARTERVRRWRAREVPRRSAMAAGLAGLLVASNPAASGIGPLRDLERRSVDSRLQSLPPSAPDSRLRLVVLDDASLRSGGIPLGSRQMADEMGERLERVFTAGARGVAIDLTLPSAWSHSELFSRFVLRHQDALTLAAHVSSSGEFVGPEVLQGLTTVALGPDAVRRLFGLVNLDEDPDGVVRRAHLGYRDPQEGYQETWAAHAARRFRGAPVSVGSHPDPDVFWIDSSIDWRQVERVSWKDVPERLQRQPSWFDGALVFVGSDLAGSGDEVHRIASGAAIPGVLLQAMIADTMLRGFPIREASRPGAFVVLGAWVGLAGLSLWVLAASRPSLPASVGIGLGLLCVLSAFAVFTRTRTLVPMVSPALATGVLVLFSLLLRRALSPFPRS